MVSGNNKVRHALQTRARGSTIKIEELLYNYSINNNNLIISFQEASDGPRMEFVKIE